MNDSTSSGDLLHQLRLDRSQRDDDEPGPRRGWLVAIVVVVVIALLAVGGWYVLRDRPVTVSTATAVAAASGAGAAPVLQASGYVVARREATVSAQIIGTLVAVNVEEGEHVRKGQVLARLEDTQYRAQLDAAKAQYAAARARVAQARAVLKQARDNARRLHVMVRKAYVSEQAAEQADTQVVTDRAALETTIRQAQAAHEQVKAAQINFDYTIVRAPFNGVITDKAAQVGEIVSPYSGGGFTRTGVATVVDMNSLEVDVDVNESYISRVLPGMPVEAVLDAYPDWKIPAHVIAIIPSADKSKGTVKVRIGLDQKDPRIIPQMGVRVSFLEKSAPHSKPLEGVLVPASAVVRRDGQSVVYTVEKDHARRVGVTSGKKLSDMVQIPRGLAAGTVVITDPPASLRDGEKVKPRKGAGA